MTEIYAMLAYPPMIVFLFVEVAAFVHLLVLQLHLILLWVPWVVPSVWFECYDLYSKVFLRSQPSPSLVVALVFLCSYLAFWEETVEKA